MKASEFEFRYRSLFNLIQFWIAFQMYSLDHINIILWFVLRDTPHVARWAHLAFSFAALLLLLAAAIRTWAAAYLSSEVVHDPNLHTEALVADGPYRHVRNPLYMGTFLMSVGLGFLASRTGFVILVVGAAIRILRLVGREEAELKMQRGEPFLQYCVQVPRFVPSLLPRIPSGHLTPRWGQAFLGEVAMWGFFLTMAAFAITLRSVVAWTLAGATLLLWFFRNIAARLGRRGAV
jgi:protein-S-isoprenylcysteine O-methyltransferase Ste14